MTTENTSHRAFLALVALVVSGLWLLSVSIYFVARKIPPPQEQSTHQLPNSP